MKIKNILLWIITCFFILATLAYLSTPGALLTGMLCLLCAILCCPIIHKILKKAGKMPERWILITSVILLFFISMFAYPQDNSNETKGVISETSNDSDDSNNSLLDVVPTIKQDDSKKAEITKTIKKDIQVDNKSGNKSESITVASQPNKVTNSKMTVYFLDVGQADSIIIESAGHYMLVDAGNNGDGDFVVNYLKDLGAKSLDYVIGTHPHEDHIGGLDDVIDNFKVSNIIMPEVTTTTDTFDDVVSAIEDNGLLITTPVVGDEYKIGEAEFTILSPNDDYQEEYNDWSVGIKLTNGENSFVMCGDAEQKAEDDICNNGINLIADVLKIGHHGSDTSTSDLFLEAVNPTYAVISVGEGNQYGHPALETLKKLKDAGIKYFRTDEQGTIIAVSDGKKITWNARPSKSLEAGNNTEGTSSQSNTSATVTENKTDNTSTQDNKSIEVHITETGSKYHSSGCQYLRKSDIVTTLDNALAMGLSPCSKCNPPQ
jgi:competence protein ComEC